MRNVLALLFLIPSVAFGQVQISRQVICPLGMDGSGSIHVSATLGQVEVTTVTADSLTLTQGFQQPDHDDLTIGISLTWPECDNGQGATLVIADIGGCGNNDASIFWEGELLEGNTITGLQPGFYDLEILSGAGCTLNFDFPIPPAPEGLPPCDLEFYNLLTPNNDGDNDLWWIDNIQADTFRENSVQVFNRWGNQVWTGENYDNDAVYFDGTHSNGEPLPDGTYYYVVEAAGTKFTGYIELTR